MDQGKLNKIINDWINKKISSEEAMNKVHILNNLIEIAED